MQISNKNYLGIDVSKPWFDVSFITVINHVKQPMITERFDNSIEGMKGFKTWLKTHAISLHENSLLVIENTSVITGSYGVFAARTKPIKRLLMVSKKH